MTLHTFIVQSARRRFAIAEEALRTYGATIEVARRYVAARKAAQFAGLVVLAAVAADRAARVRGLL